MRVSGGERETPAADDYRSSQNVRPGLGARFPKASVARSRVGV
jgi:hypothetical protein